MGLVWVSRSSPVRLLGSSRDDVALRQKIDLFGISFEGLFCIYDIAPSSPTPFILIGLSVPSSLLLLIQEDKNSLFFGFASSIISLDLFIGTTVAELSGLGGFVFWPPTLVPNTPARNRNILLIVSSFFLCRSRAAIASCQRC